MPILWNDTLATGHRQIDLQHQELIELTNALEAAVVAGRPSEALDEVMPKLNAYVLFHFGTEEAMLGATPPDQAAAHRQQHREFRARITTLQAEPHTDQRVNELVEYLKRWLVEHIMKTDRELARHLANLPYKLQ